MITLGHFSLDINKLCGLNEKKKENLAQTVDCDITYDIGFIKKFKNKSILNKKNTDDTIIVESQATEENNNSNPILLPVHTVNDTIIVEPQTTKENDSNSNPIILPANMVDAIITEIPKEKVQADGVNFSEAQLAPVEEAGAEKIEVDVVSTPKNGEPKVKVTIPYIERIVSDYIDYESFNKIKQSNSDDVINAIRVFHSKFLNEKIRITILNFLNSFNPNKEAGKLLKYELIRHKKGNLLVRLSVIINGIKYYIDIFPGLNRVDMDHFIPNTK